MRANSRIRTLILCGGKGVRAYPLTLEQPKALLDVGGRPILRHVMEIYARQGFVDFVLATGFKGDLIREYAAQTPRDWSIEVIDTGEHSETAERVAKCRSTLGPTFFLTYTDGVGNIDLHASLERHRSHPGAATVTVVPLPSPYGTVDTDADDRVRKFVEKPSLTDYWINGGFFVMDQSVFDTWRGLDLEREVLPTLATAGELYVYRHTGFWKSMDTQKDALLLTALYDATSADGGDPPWLRFETPASS